MSAEVKPRHDRSTLFWTLARLASLPSEVVSNLATAFTSGLPVEDDAQRMKDLAALTQIPMIDISQMLSDMSALYRHYRDATGGEDQNSFADDLTALLIKGEVVDHANAPAVTQMLMKFLVPLPQRDLAIKRERLIAGFLPRLQSVDTFVDFRPLFADDLKSIIETQVVVQANLKLVHDDNKTQEIIFAMDAASIDNIVASLQRARHKLTLANAASAKMLSINPKN